MQKLVSEEKDKLDNSELQKNAKPCKSQEALILPMNKEK